MTKQLSQTARQRIASVGRPPVLVEATGVFRAPVRQLQLVDATTRELARIRNGQIQECRY
jgi:hypothetical protein